MSNDSQVDIPEAWHSLDLDQYRGVLMVIGGPDTGKTTFAHYLFRRLESLGKRVALLDGDPGQGVMGPPTTMTLSHDLDSGAAFAPDPEIRRYFVGSNSPRGHMLPMLVGAARLVNAAVGMGADVIVYDTCGLVDPGQGGLALKNAKIDLLLPYAVFGLQQQDELAALLVPLRRASRTQVIELRPSNRSRARDAALRQVNRMAQFGRYFSSAKNLVLDWTTLAVFPTPLFRINRLVAFEGRSGFTIGLGIVREINRTKRSVSLYTPLDTLEGVVALRLGDLLINPDSFREERIG
jgi:polynucleotide 5'-hydroxyl-kinase GRC3/NOL9